MKPKIEWIGELPTKPPATQVEDAVRAAVAHPRNFTPPAKEVVLMRLERDELQRKVDGIGYSSDGEPVVKFHYSLVKPWNWGYEALAAVPSTPPR